MTSFCRVTQFSKFNDFSKKEKEKSNFEPLLMVSGACIVSNTFGKVGLPVKMRGQPNSYDKRFQRYGFLSFLPKSPS